MQTDKEYNEVTVEDLDMNKLIFNNGDTGNFK